MTETHSDIEHRHTLENRPVMDWVLYDRDCGVCSYWIARWRGSLEKRGFGIAPLQEEWVKDRLQMKATELIEDFRIFLANGTQLRGAEAYRYAMKRIWWMFPVYLFSVTPICRVIFDICYRFLVRHRHVLSRTCKPSDII